jgi:hypothetical protein
MSDPIDTAEAAFASQQQEIAGWYQCVCIASFSSPKYRQQLRP